MIISPNELSPCFMCPLQKDGKGLALWEGSSMLSASSITNEVSNVRTVEPKTATHGPVIIGPYREVVDYSVLVLC